MSASKLMAALQGEAPGGSLMPGPSSPTGEAAGGGGRGNAALGEEATTAKQEVWQVRGEKARVGNPHAARDAELALRLVRKLQVLEGERAPWDAQWQEIAEKFMPRKAQITARRMHADSSLESRIFDTTAHDALETMAAGLMAWTTPSSEPWFALEPVLSLRRSDRVKMWLQDVTQLMQEYLANSNYYTERHENLLNKCCFGTNAMFCELVDGQLRFEAFPVGSYCIEEDAFGQVAALYRKFPLTALQAVEMFGAEALSEKTRGLARDVQKQSQVVEFLHAVYERPAGDVPSGAHPAAGIYKPWASCYVELAEKRLVRESGFDSFPVACARYLKWDSFGVRSPWGYSPAFAALPDARQINFLSAMLDVAVERAVDPALVVPDEMEGEIITTARGLNYVDRNVEPGRWPRELFKVPPLDYGEALLERKKKAIEAKFHVELFKMFAQIQRQMTAREVAERAGERLTLITPAFTRDTTEECAPLLRRVFLLCAQAGLLPPPPNEAIVSVNGSMAEVPDPKVTFTSRLALAIKSLRNVAAERTMERTMERDMQLAAVRPDILDNYDFDRMVRDGALANGMPADWLVDEQERDAQRQAKAQAAQQQQQMAMMEQGAKAVGAMGGPEALAGLMGGSSGMPSMQGLPGMPGAAGA